MNRAADPSSAPPSASGRADQRRMPMGLSPLRMGAVGRLAVAVGLAAVLWLAVAWAII